MFWARFPEQRWAKGAPFSGETLMLNLARWELTRFPLSLHPTSIQFWRSINHERYLAWKSPGETNRQVFFSAAGEENVNIVADSKEQLESSWRALQKTPTRTAQRESSCKRVPGAVLIIGTLWKAIFNVSSASTQDRSSQWHYFTLPNTPPSRTWFNVIRFQVCQAVTIRMSEISDVSLLIAETKRDLHRKPWRFQRLPWKMKNKSKGVALKQIKLGRAKFPCEINF